MGNELQNINQKTITLDKAEIEKLYAFVNGPRDWKIDVNSHELVDKIIELWFQSQGYDFYDNPYPNVIEWATDKKRTIIMFTYEITNNLK